MGLRRHLLQPLPSLGRLGASKAVAVGQQADIEVLEVSTRGGVGVCSAGQATTATIAAGTAMPLKLITDANLLIATLISAGLEHSGVMVSRAAP